ELRHSAHHLQRRQSEVWAICRVIRARWNQLNRVGAENGQISDVTFPVFDIPSVIRVCLRPIPKLMPAQRVLRRRAQIQLLCQHDFAYGHLQLAEQASDTKEYTSLIVSDDC